MNRILRKCLLTVLLFLLLAAGASCGLSKESPSSSASAAASASGKQPAPETTALSSASDTTAAGTTAAPAVSPAPVLPPEIVFDTPEDLTNTYSEKLYVEANLSSVSVIGGGNKPVHIRGTIANSSMYCFSLLYEISDVEYAMDGSSLAILLDCNTYGAGRLVYSDGKTAVDIASDVDTFHLSGDGSAVLYLVTPKYEHGVGGDLYYYDCTTGESTLIAKGAGRLFAISPCGKSISYTTFYKIDDPDALTCCSMTIGQTPVKVADDSYCAALTDDARTVYYLTKTEEGEILNVRYDGVSRQLSIPYDPLTYNAEEVFFFNIDQTQIVFNSDGAAYFSMSGSDPYKISDFPARSFQGKSNFYDIPNYLYKSITDSARSYITTSVYGTKNLCYVPFQTGDNNLLFFDEKMKITEYTLPGYWDGVLFSGNAIIANNGDGYTIYKDYRDKDTVTIQGIESPLITDKQTFYYLSPKEVTGSDSVAFIDELYAVFGCFDTANAEFVASNVSGLQLFEKDGPDTLYFLAYPEDHDEEVERDYNLKPFLDLYAVEEVPGAKPVLVAEQVCNFETGDFGIVYWKYEGPFKEDYKPLGGSYMASVGVYSSKDGVSFQYVMERPYVFQYGG